MIAVLQNLTYRRLFLAQVVALIGTGLATVALGLLAFSLAGANAGAVLGTALAIKMIAYVAVAPIASAFAERVPRRAMLVALDLVRAASKAHLNVDLIYGMEGQTSASFVTSLEFAMRWRPEEVYLYPLYVRPLTFLGKRAASWDDHRLELYRTGRDWLCSHGYRQRSMRVFQREDAGELQLPEYHAEDDGMVGLGVGARSYTKAVHYAHDWAVGPREVRGIIDAYLERPGDSFRFAHSGFELSAQEQQRRWVVLTLFGEGLDEAAFARRFGTSVTTALPMLEALCARGLAVRADGKVTLTASGLERSDALGPWLFSSAVETLMSEWEAR